MSTKQVCPFKWRVYRNLRHKFWLVIFLRAEEGEWTGTLDLKTTNQVQEDTFSCDFKRECWCNKGGKRRNSTDVSGAWKLYHKKQSQTLITFLCFFVAREANTYLSNFCLQNEPADTGQQLNPGESDDTEHCAQRYSILRILVIGDVGCFCGASTNRWSPPVNTGWTLSSASTPILDQAIFDVNDDVTGFLGWASLS